MDKPLPKLTGGFIQLDDVAKSLKERWSEFFEQMSKIRLNTFIIQYLESVDRDCTKFNAIEGADPVEEILKQAAMMHGSVYIGLRNYQAWDELRKNEKYINTVLTENQRLADLVWKRYGAHPSFKGWYIVQELANYKYEKKEELDLLNGYFVTLSKYCRAIDRNQKPVAISPYFNPTDDFKNAPDFASDLKTILKDSEVDIVMLQDSVGERQIKPDEFPEKVKPYYEALKALATANGQQFWANVESFKWVGKNRRPTDFATFKQQLLTADEYSKTLVTFDCYHYMNPLGFSHEKEQEHRDAEKLLYDEYEKAPK